MIRILMGTSGEIESRMAASPSTSKTTITSVVSNQVFNVQSISSFSVGNSIVVGKKKGIIGLIAGSRISLENPLESVPNVGATVKHYDADYTQYRDLTQPFTFVSDIKTGGSTGSVIGSQNLILFDWDGLMVDPVDQNRITIYDDFDPSICLYGGFVVITDRIMKIKDNSVPIYQWQIQSQGYQWESSHVGINEEPFVNVNAGKFLDYLRKKWTNLDIGEIDTVDSPTIDYIRLASFKKFSDVGSQLSALWPGSEFFVKNDHSSGLVYFRKAITVNAPIVLDQDYLDKIGNNNNQYVDINKDNDKIINVLAYPYYKERTREPDFHVQDTVSDNAFLRTSVVLSGQPSSLEEIGLIFDDFSDGILSDGFIELDIYNPNPPDGYNSSDGFLIEGELVTVPGFHLLDGNTVTGVNPQPVGRITDPGTLQPFTGEEGQTIYAKEVVVNRIGYGLILGIVDQTTLQTVTLSGSTTTVINVADSSIFLVKDIVEISGEYRYVQAKSTGVLTLNSALSGAPSAGVTVDNNRLSRSRIQFGLYFRNGGQLTYFRNGVEKNTAPWTYTAPTTYSFRLYMKTFEAIVVSATSTSTTLDSATNFSIGDIVNLYTLGSRVKPEIRAITGIAGSVISYAATINTAKAGYRVATFPKIVVQAKGGTYGSIIGRTWTTLYTDVNTWQTSSTVLRPDCGIAVAIHQLSFLNSVSLLATISSFQAKNAIPVHAKIGSRDLFIGTQDSDSADADIDCLIRKVGSHYQLDFFPDTKALWASGTTLELRYTERFKYILKEKDLNSIRNLAIARGYTIGDNASEQDLIKLGGMAYDNIPLLPTPISDIDALNQSRAILSAGSSPAFTLSIYTNTVVDQMCEAGQLIVSQLPGIPDMVIQQVEIKEAINRGAAVNDDGSSVYNLIIRAGTVDRLGEIINNRSFTTGSRLVLDDGKQDDSFTNIDVVGFQEVATPIEAWQVITTPFNITDESGNQLITEASDNIISG